ELPREEHLARERHGAPLRDRIGRLEPAELVAHALRGPPRRTRSVRVDLLLQHGIQRPRVVLRRAIYAIEERLAQAPRRQERLVEQPVQALHAWAHAEVDAEGLQTTRREPVAARQEHVVVLEQV